MGTDKQNDSEKGGDFRGTPVRIEYVVDCVGTYQIPELFIKIGLTLPKKKFPLCSFYGLLMDLLFSPEN